VLKSGFDVTGVLRGSSSPLGDSIALVGRLVIIHIYMSRYYYSYIRFVRLRVVLINSIHCGCLILFESDSVGKGALLDVKPRYTYISTLKYLIFNS
jgi:hypothetical protein